MMNYTTAEILDELLTRLLETDGIEFCRAGQVKALIEVLQEDYEHCIGAHFFRV
jgi:hypothetical protein